MANQSIAFSVPTAYEDKLAAIDRAQKMAEMLQQQAYEPLQSTGSYKGIQAPISPLSGLAKMLDAYTANKNLESAKSERTALSEEQRAGLEDYLNNAPKGTEAIPGTPGMPATMGTTGAVNDYFKQPESQNVPGLAMPLDQTMPSLGTPGMAATEGTPETPAQPATRAQLLAHAMQGVVSGNPRIAPLANAEYAQLTKVREPLKLGAGDTVYDPNTGKAMFSAPAGPRAGKLGEYDQYVEQTIAAGGKPMSSMDYSLTMAKAGRAPAAPRERKVYDAQRGGLVNLDTGEFYPVTQGGKEIGAKLSPAAAKDLLSIEQSKSTIAGAINEVVKNPTAFGFKRGAATDLGTSTESIAGRFDTPEEAAARAYVFNNVSAVIKERAGTAQSAQELTRINSFMPGTKDSSTQILNKLTGYEKYLDDLEAGTKGNPTQVKPVDAPPLNTLQEGQQTKFGNGQVWTLDNGKAVQVK
jgi:hypothetical protein